MRDRDTETCRASSGASALASDTRYAEKGWRVMIRVPVPRFANVRLPTPQRMVMPRLSVPSA